MKDEMFLYFCAKKITKRLGYTINIFLSLFTFGKVENELWASWGYIAK